MHTTSLGERSRCACRRRFRELRLFVLVSHSDAEWMKREVNLLIPADADREKILLKKKRQYYKSHVVSS